MRDLLLVVLHVLLLAAVLPAASAARSGPAAAATPDRPSASAPPRLRFEEVGAAAGARHVHTTRSFAGSPKAQVLEMFTDGGAAVAVGDFDGDGWDDLFLTDSGEGTANHLLRNLTGDTGELSFADVAEVTGVAGGNDARSIVADALWLDYDGDGHRDLLVARFGTPLLHRNLGPVAAGEPASGGTPFRFHDVSAEAGLAASFDNTIAALAFDYDGDGWLDLLLGHYFPRHDLTALGTPHVLPNDLDDADNGGGLSLWRNVPLEKPSATAGSRGFVEVTEAAGLAHHTGWTLDVGHADLDGDGDADLYVAGDYGTDRLFWNDGDGTFTDGTEAAIGFDTRKGMNVDAGDFDRDGRLDLFVTNITDEYMRECNMLWQNLGDGTFLDVSRETGTCDSDWGWAGKFADLDNDGWEDLFTVNGLRSAGEENYIPLLLQTILTPGVDFSDLHSYPDIGDRTWSGYQRQRLFRNLGNGTFADVAAAAGVDNDLDGRGVGVADLDRDGRLDLVQTNARQPSLLYRNVTEGAGHWVGLELEGGTGSNRDAVGARVTLTAGGVRQVREVDGGNGYASQSTLALHFGLGDADRIEAVEVRWPSGRVERREAAPGESTLPIDAYSGIVEGAWSGEAGNGEVGDGDAAGAERLEALRNLGKAMYESSATQYEAVDVLAEAAALSGEPRDRLNHALALLRAGQEEAGIELLEAVQEAAPALPHTWFNLGIAYKRAGRYEDALAQLRHMAALAPEEPVTWYNLGVLHQLTGSPAEALAAFERAAALDPYLAGPRFQLATAFRQAGRPEEAQRALAEFRELKALQADDAVAEDLEWSYYSELYDPREPRSAAAPPHFEPVFAMDRILSGLDPQRASLDLLRADDDDLPDLLVVQPDGVVLVAGASLVDSDPGDGDPGDGKDRPAVQHLVAPGLRAAAPGDLDNDGLSDLALVTDQGVFLWRNLRERATGSDGTSENGSRGSATGERRTGEGGTREGEASSRGARTSVARTSVARTPVARTAAEGNAAGGTVAGRTATGRTATDERLGGARESTPASSWHLHAVPPGAGASATPGDPEPGATPEPRPLPLPASAAGSFRGAAWLDYDHDYDVDLLLLGSPGALLRNVGGGAFAEPPEPFPFGDGTAVAAVQLDLVPDAPGLDLVVAYAERPGRVFRDLLGGRYQAADLPALPAGATELLARDLDNDGWTDLVARTPAGPVLLRNLPGAGFAPLDRPEGLADAAAVALIDLENRGIPELVAGSLLSRNRTGSAPRGAGGSGGVGGPGGSSGPEGAGDAEAAGGPAAPAPTAAEGGRALAVGSSPAAARGPTPAFAAAEPLPLPPGTAPLTAVAAADLDGDGRADLAAVTAEGHLVRLLNRTDSPHGWLRVDLAGIKNLVLAPGAEIEVKAGSSYQKRLWRGVPLVFGLGPHGAAETVRITWPNGLIQNETQQPARSHTRFEEAQRLSGSCPMVFTWNGRGLEFVSDVLGVAPLGASAGDGIYFQIDHDEYLSISAEQLVPREGFYDVRLTEELREVGYLDQARLLAVDRPVGIDVFHSDKFKGPPYPDFELYGVEERIPPRAARDHHGRDVLERVLQRDRGYPDGFERDYAGLAERHFLELEFPWEAAEATGSPAEPVLVLHGWVDWADGSTFKATSQDEAGPKVELPSLQVRDADGAWRTVVADMGVPAGKPKTIVVELARDWFAAPAGDAADGTLGLRIVTSLAAYWDEAFLAVPVDLAGRSRVTRLAPTGADLRFRGFSRVVVHPQRLQPEWFVYDDVRTTSMWDPTPGLYTRYGDVSELLQDIDDRFVVFGAGDEVALRFAATELPPLPEGWRRDFLLFVDGWAKDGDLNTAHARSVEPLPFHAMSGYPYAEGEELPDGPEHRMWRQTYQTREALRLNRPLRPPGPERAKRPERAEPGGTAGWAETEER